jgi:hypothetical protein
MLGESGIECVEQVAVFIDDALDAVTETPVAVAYHVVLCITLPLPRTFVFRCWAGRDSYFTHADRHVEYGL